MKLTQIYRAITEAEEVAQEQDELSGFLDLMAKLEQHAKERKVLEPNYSRDDLIDDIKREEPDMEDSKANKMADFVFDHLSEDISNYAAIPEEHAATAEELDVGDPVKITGNVSGQGQTGTIDSFGQDKRFVIVQVDGKLNSYHSSDVSFAAQDENDESEIEEATPAMPKMSAEEMVLHRNTIKQMAEKMAELNRRYVLAKNQGNTELMNKIKAKLAEIAADKADILAHIDSRQRQLAESTVTGKFRRQDRKVIDARNNVIVECASARLAQDITEILNTRLIQKKKLAESSTEISQAHRDIAEGRFVDVDVFGIHAELLREHLLLNPALYENTQDFKELRRFLDNHTTPQPIENESYLYVSVMAIPQMNYISVSHFTNTHKLVKIISQMAYFDINGTIERFPETGKLSSDALSQIYFFDSVEEFNHFNMLLKLKFAEYKQTSKILAEGTTFSVKAFNAAVGKALMEAEGDPEGIPHLTKSLLKNILKGVGEEGAHAIVKSLEWGDGAAKELLELITNDLKKHVGIEESVKQRLDPKCWKGRHKEGTKIKGGVRVNNCVPNESIDENFADGKNPQDKGDAKRHGVDTKGSVSSLRKTAKQGGRKGQLAHWMANMKAGKAKKESVTESTEQSLQKKIQAKRDALSLAREQRRARGNHQQGQREIKLQAEIDRLSTELTQLKQQSVAESDLDRFKKYIRPAVKTTPKIERTTNPAGRTTNHIEWKVTTPTGEIIRYKSKKEAQAHYDSFSKQGVTEGQEQLERRIRIKDGDGKAYIIPAIMEKEFLAMWNKQFSTPYGSIPFYQYNQEFRDKFSKYRAKTTNEEGVAEATSAAVRMQRAADRQRAKSDASLQRTPSSIPKKEEPKTATPTIKEFAPGGNFKPPAIPKGKGNDPWGDDDRSQIAQAVKGLLASGNKVDWQVPGQMGHVVSVDDRYITLRKWNQPRSKMRFALPITADRDSKYQIVPKGEKHYRVISSGLDEGKQDMTKGVNHWHDAGVKDARRGVKPNPRTYALKDPEPKHPEEIDYYMTGYKSVKQGVTEGLMNPQELGYDHGNRYDSKNRNPFPKGSTQHQAYEQGHEEGKSDWWEQDQQGITESSIHKYNNEEFRVTKITDAEFAGFKVEYLNSWGSPIAFADFAKDGKDVEVRKVEVDSDSRGQGFASLIYNFVKSQGFTIHRSPDQTAAGKRLWDTRKSKETNVWEQGVAEGKSRKMAQQAAIAIAKKKKKVMTEDSKECPVATQDIKTNLENRQKAIDEYGYGPLNPDLPNTKFWMKKVDEWNLDSANEAKQSLCGNCAAFDQRQKTLDCIAQGIDSDQPNDAEGVIEAGDLGYCKFLKFKCASLRTCDAWVTGGPLTDDVKSVDESDMALQFAKHAHTGQTRSGGEPYITHPMRVADSIRQYKQSHNLEALIDAALLHDTIEDTDTTHEALQDLFGGLVASLVKELTSNKDEIKKMGKAAYLANKMATMSSYALVIKLADRLDNVKDIATAKTPEWRAKYKAETLHILDYIAKNRVLSGTHQKLIGLIRSKLNEINDTKEVEENLTLAQQFDIIEEMVMNLASTHGVDADIIWEDFDAVDDETLFEVAAWQTKAGKNKKGGLNKKGVASYRRQHPGSKLQTAVTTKPSKLKPGSKAAKRRKSFCARMGGMKGPMKDKNGKPTRKALALRKWNCNESVDNNRENVTVEYDDEFDMWNVVAWNPSSTANRSGKTLKKFRSQDAAEAYARTVKSQTVSEYRTSFNKDGTIDSEKFAVKGRVEHGLIGPGTIRKIAGNSIYVQSDRDGRIYRLSASSLEILKDNGKGINTLSEHRVSKVSVINEYKNFKKNKK